MVVVVFVGMALLVVMIVFFAGFVAVVVAAAGAQMQHTGFQLGTEALDAAQFAAGGEVQAEELAGFAGAALSG